MCGKASTAHNVLEHMLLDESVKPTKLPLSLLEDITNNFSGEREIGRGGFAVVYKGMLENGTTAVKKLYTTLDMDETKFRQEVQCLLKVRHINIVRFLGYCADTQGEMTDYEGKFVMADVRNRLLCFEFVPNGSLHDYIADASCGLEWRVRYQIIKGICDGLDYLHENHIVHLDLKPSNILLDNNMVPKICDFGLSRCFDENKSKTITSKLVGSLGYLAPEAYSGLITFKMDIYSLGVIIIEMLTGHKGYSTVEKVLESWTNRLEISHKDTALQQVRACAEIGIMCIDSNPENRPVTQRIIKTFKELRSTNEFVEARSSSSVGQVSINGPAVPVVVVDKREAGIRLVHALLACAEAVQHGNFNAAEALVKQIPMLASSQGGAMRKVAAYFGDALARRVYRFRPAPDSSLLDAAFADLLPAHFNEPFCLKFAHFTANQVILEAFADCRRVHVVDFGIKQGMQWPALLQALALRPGGPPSFRLTGVGPPQPDETDALQQVGWKLAQFARTIRVDFQYRGLIAATLADLEPFMLQPDGEDTDDEPEVIAVNSVIELHRLLAQPGALEKVLGTLRAVRPSIVTVVEQEPNHNSGSFLDRFTESLHYYSTMFDSLEGAGSCSEVYLGRQICNVVACEGAERTERHETLRQWRTRLGRAWFEPVHLGSNAYKQLSTLLALFAGVDGYRVEQKDGCLTLGWHTRPLITISAWRAAAP